jgi:hypothetical protein
MYQFGNLAMICAGRSDVLLQLVDGHVTIYVENGLGRQQFTAYWQDNAEVEKLIYELNHGSLRKEAFIWRNLLKQCAN